MLRHHWTIVSFSSFRGRSQTIRVIWSFKHKRIPNERHNKHKAQLCPHGNTTVNKKLGDMFPCQHTWNLFLPCICPHSWTGYKIIEILIGIFSTDIDKSTWIVIPEDYKEKSKPETHDLGMLVFLN